MEVKDQLVDNLMTSIGQPGRFQTIACAFLCVNVIITTSNHLAMVFYAAKTKYHCKVENGDIVKDLVPTVIRNNKRQWDGCHLYAGNNTTETIPCTDGWTYDLEDGEATIISEVCVNALKCLVRFVGFQRCVAVCTFIKSPFITSPHGQPT